MRRLDCHESVKHVERGYETALQSVRALIRIVIESPAYLDANNINLAALRNLEVELHDLYFVRMFASFESSLRHYWKSCVKNTEPPTRQLISSIATRRGVPQYLLDTVQEIREFRNFLIHEEHEVTSRPTIGEASRALNHYLSRLPINW